MDNLAHTLVGVALGRAVAGDRVPAAGWIGAVAANAPDWTEYLVGLRPARSSFAYYEMHRGITHALSGAVVETAGLTALLWGVFTAYRFAQGGGRTSDGRRAPLVSIPALLVLVGATVLSHVYMDWQGSYGLRPWLPWSGRWYYADWVAIVDPLFWLVPLVGLAWGAQRHWRDLTPLAVIAAFVLWAEFVWRPEVPTAWLRAVSVGIVALGAVGWVRHWFGWAERRRAAFLSLAILAVYTGAQAVASAAPKAAARRAALARFGPGAQWAALTRIGTPFVWEPVYASRDTVAGPGWAEPRRLSDARVRRALTEPGGREMAVFARFLAAEVDSGPSGVVVVVRDARYARPPVRLGWGVVSVRLGHGATP